MTYGNWLLATVVILVLGGSSLAADPPKDDPNFTKEQNKFIKELQTKLAAPPLNPNEKEKYAQAVQDTFNKLLSTKTQPSKQTTDTLATSLVRGLNNGNISIQQSVDLAKVMTKVLDSNIITPQTTFQLVRSVEPIVGNTKLSGIEKTQLYADVLRVIKTAPTYKPE